MKYKVEITDDHPSESDLQDQYRQGYVLLSVTSLYWPTYNSGSRRFWSTYVYTGGSTASRMT